MTTRNVRRLIFSPRASVMLCAAGLLFSCVFDTNDRPPLTMERLDVPADSVSALPVITCAFSSPVIDTTVQFAISPPQQFYWTLCQTNDTFTIVFTELLAGSSRYVVRPAGTIVAENGAQMFPDDDSVVVYTKEYALEHEPNDVPATADTLRGIICGTIAMASDTDRFVLSATEETAQIYIHSLQTRTSFSLYDSTLGGLGGSSPDRNSDTVALPSGYKGRMHLKAFAPNRSAGTGFYEIGILPLP